MHDLELAVLAAVLVGVVLHVLDILLRFVAATRWARKKAIRYAFDQIAELTSAENEGAFQRSVRDLVEDVDAALEASKLSTRRTR